jgi:hypothetical protein
VSGAAAAADERDFFRRKEAEEEGDDFAGDDEGETDFDCVASSPELLASSPGVASARSFSCSGVAAVAGAPSSVSTIVFGILRFDPLTATVVLITRLPLAAESGDLESALAASAGKSVSTGPGFEEPAASLSLLLADSG